MEAMKLTHPYCAQDLRSCRAQEGSQRMEASRGWTGLCVDSPQWNTTITFWGAAQPECVRWCLQTNKRHERDNPMICNKEIATPVHLSVFFWVATHTVAKVAALFGPSEAMSNLVWCCSGDVAMAKGRHLLTCDIQSKVHWSSWNWVRAVRQWFV